MGQTLRIEAYREKLNPIVLGRSEKAQEPSVSDCIYRLYGPRMLIALLIIPVSSSLRAIMCVLSWYEERTR